MNDIKKTNGHGNVIDLSTLSMSLTGKIKDRRKALNLPPLPPQAEGKANNGHGGDNGIDLSGGEV